MVAASAYDDTSNLGQAKNIDDEDSDVDGELLLDTFSSVSDPSDSDFAPLREQTHLICRYCPKLEAKYFKSKPGLDLHEARHLNPFKCDDCGSTFWKKSMLNGHKKS